jgi:dihydrofolate reductase
MRRVILSLATSFDGFIEGPNGEIDWLTFDEETGEVLGKFLEEIDTVLYGRVSYEAWGNYHPMENSSGFEKDFYGKLHRMTKYVFSSSKKDFDGNVFVINSDVEETIRELKEKSGKDIWLYGGAGLITTFMNADLIDEFRIAVAPIILGDGMPLFKEINQRVKLNLLDVKASKSGMVEFKYERAEN